MSYRRNPQMSFSSSPADAEMAPAVDDKSFAQAWNDRVASAFPTGFNEYDNVRVLLSYWQDDDLGVVSEVKALQKAFETTFNYTVHIFEIPSENTEIALTHQLEQLSHELQSGRSLLVLYYGGHGDINEDRQSILLANTIRVPTSEIRLSFVLGVLESAAYDVLLIVDACVAPPTVGHHSHKYKREWISSSGMGGYALGPGPNSFTSHLIKVFQDVGDDPISAALVYYRVLERQSSSGKISSTPLYAILSTSHQSSILLTPHRRKRRQAPHDDAIISFNLTRDQMSPKGINMVAEWLRYNAPLGIRSVRLDDIEAHEGDESRLIIRVLLRDGEVPDTREWKRWLSSVPDGLMKNAVVDLGSGVATSSGSRLSKEIQRFVESLSMSTEIADVFPTRNGRYEKVSVLMLLWEDEQPELELRPDLKNLADIFEQTFHFTVEEIWPIPRLDPQDALELRIGEFRRDHNKPNELVIVIYAGHGKDTFLPGKINDSIWENRYGDKVNWSTIQPKLESAESDVIIILNCCYAFNAALSGKRCGSNVIMAAADRDQKAWTKDKSYLRALADKLESFGDSSFTTEQLNNRIDSERQKWKLWATPMRKLLDDDEMHDIMLRRQPQQKYDARDPESMHKFYIEVTTNEPRKLNPRQWMQWFRTPYTPDYIEEVKFRTGPELQADFDLDRARKFAQTINKEHGAR